MTLDHDICYRALETRDARFDGRFFTGVLTTGIYCRPVCPARTPKRRNVRFFACAAAAEAEGFRPCMRCRPETSPGTPAWSGTSASVSRALRLIDDGFLDTAGVDELAACTGHTSRHLRRLFDEHLGASPIAIAQARRVHFARRLLDETELSITDVALSSGFGSVRRFNDAFRKTFNVSPTEVRRGRKPAGTEFGLIELHLPCRFPFEWNRVLSFIAARAIPGVERVVNGRYSRLVSVGDNVGVVEIMRDPRAALVLRVPPALGSGIRSLADAARRLFDLRTDSGGIMKHLAQDPYFMRIIFAQPGVRVPGAWDPFETSVRAILGQQISVKGATTLCGRIVKKYGEPIDDPGDPALTHLFPTPERLRRARFSGVGITGARAKTIRALAVAFDDGTVNPGASPGLEETVASLETIPGIGPWTAHYIAMRAGAEPDAFPSGDLALRKAAAQALHLGLDIERELIEHAERWRPWRAYATMALWNWYTEEQNKGVTK